MASLPAKSKPVFRVTDLVYAEYYAMRGLTEEQIRVLLKYSKSEWDIMTKNDGISMYEALEIGRVKGIAEVAGALHSSARSGKDSGSARFYLERQGGHSWRPPSSAVPVIMVTASRVEIDQADIDRRFARQSALLDEHGFDCESAALPALAAPERRET